MLKAGSAVRGFDFGQFRLRGACCHGQGRFQHALGASEVVSREIVVKGAERPMMKERWVCGRGLDAYPDANPARDEGSSYGFWPQHPKMSQTVFALTGIPLLLSLSA